MEKRRVEREGRLCGSESERGKERWLSHRYRYLGPARAQQGLNAACKPASFALLLNKFIKRCDPTPAARPWLRLNRDGVLYAPPGANHSAPLPVLGPLPGRTSIAPPGHPCCARMPSIALAGSVRLHPRHQDYPPDPRSTHGLVDPLRDPWTDLHPPRDFFCVELISSLECSRSWNGLENQLARKTSTSLQTIQLTSR